MAQIVIQYPLSTEGKVAALAAGVNAGDTQTIILRSPGHKAPEAPADVVARVTGSAPVEPADARTPGLVEAVEALVASTALLIRMLDPGSQANVTVEDASPELWELAVSLAETDRHGASTIDITDFQVMDYQMGGYDPQLNHIDIVAKRGPQQLDRLYTAAELLPAEKAKRDRLTERRSEVEAEARVEAARLTEQMAAQRLEDSCERAAELLAENPEYVHLPELVLLADLLKAEDKSALNSYDLRASAWNAIAKAKAETKAAEVKAWVKAHGSTRLKRFVALGLSYESEYIKERMALELPGWKEGGSLPNIEYASSPTDAELETFLAVQKRWPEAKLGLVGVCSRVPVMTWMGRTVYYAKQA